MREQPASGTFSGSTTPLIDVVFLLLIFFIMTFSISPPEGDFSIHMSQAAAAEPDAAEEMDASMRKRLPLQVRLVADAEGKLAELRINGRQSVRERPYQVLQDYVLQKIKSASDPAALRDEWEVELRADDALKYLHVVKAIDAVSGKKNDDGSVTPLLRKIKIVPDRRRPDTTPGTHVK